MKIFFLTGFFILILSYQGQLFGKGKLHPGYIITKSDDTLQGYIEYPNKRVTPDHIVFKETETHPGQIYFPGYIKGFQVRDFIFNSAVVKIDNSSVNKRTLLENPEFVLLTDTIFVQAIVLGDKGLYFSTDSTGHEKFFIKTGSEYVWLMHKRFIKSENSKQVVIANNYYIGQLITYLNACQTINPVLSEASYNYKNLLRAFLYYYGCTGTPPEYRLDEVKMTAIQRFFSY